MAKSRSGLGRDFYSLLDDNILASDKTSAATNLRISQVEPRSDQPRKEFSPEALGQLADSIAQFGVLQPIIVSLHDPASFCTLCRVSDRAAR